MDGFYGLLEKSSPPHTTQVDGFYALLEKSWAKVAGGFLVIDDAPVCEVI